MSRHQNQISMSIFGEDKGENRISVISTAAILNFGCKKNCSRMTEWHHADLGSVWFVLPESPIKHCMYAKTHLHPSATRLCGGRGGMVVVIAACEYMGVHVVKVFCLVQTTS